MVKQPLKKSAEDSAEAVETRLRRLLSANERAQAELEDRLKDADVERRLLRAMVNQIPELVYAKDTAGRYLTANDALARRYGLERADDLIGKTDVELLPPDAARRSRDLEQRIIASGTPVIDAEEEWYAKAGAPGRLRTTRLPVRDDHREIVGLVCLGRSITEGESDENGLNGAERLLFRAMIDHVPDYLFVKDAESRFVIANEAVAADLGLKPEDLIGKTDFDLHRPELASKFFNDEREVVRSGKPRLDIEEYVINAAGEERWLSTSKAPMRDERGEVIGIVGVCRDVTDRKRADAALTESESRWNFALEGAGQGVWDHDLRSGKAFFSRTWRKMRGIGPDEDVDPSREAWLARVHPDDRDGLIKETDRQNTGELEQNSFEYRERHRDGHYIWILSRGKPVEWMTDGSVARIIGTDTDITSIKDAEARAAEEKEQTYRRHLAALEKAHEAAEAAQQLAQSLARHDPLTGLPNRRVFTEALEAATRQAQRGAVSFAVLIVDLDRFKPVNDIHGHHAGDAVLREIASRIGEVVRGGDTVARLGGDEFALILHLAAMSDEPASAAALLAERIIGSVGQVISIGDDEVEVGASIGIALCPTDGAEPDTLLRAADMAMYRAKEEGRGVHRFFEQGMEAALRERIALEADVRQAVAQQKITPYYQPLMRLAENRLVGFEVLARWQHPIRGAVEPDVFIPIVEKTGLMAELTYSLLKRACIDARSWPEHITIALNISPKHFGDPLLPAKVLAILTETEFPPKRLEIEVTESALVSDIQSARNTLVALQDLGIKISLDDFGTGYSNLYNLHELRFDKIKIDRSFVLSMGTNAESAKIVRSVINLATSLGLPTIAEGIEHLQAVNQIVESGGEYGQGYYFAKAMPAADAARLAKGTAADARKA